MAKRMKRQAKARAKSSTKAKAARTPKRAGASKATRSRARADRKPAAARATGMQSVAIGITANDAEASIKWYCDVLGFAVAQRWDEDGFRGGTVVQGGATFNIGQDDWKLGRDRKKGQGVRFFITTADDIDGYAKGITSRGGTIDHEPKDDWGFRAFAITDPDGYKITVMRPLK